MSRTIIDLSPRPLPRIGGGVRKPTPEGAASLPQVFISLIISLLVLLVVFTAVWVPLVRPQIFSLMNESNFTTTWGTELQTAGVLVLDIIVFIVALVVIAAVTEGTLSSMKV